MTTRLYRSRTDRMVGGVCGGLGRYLGIDSTFVRLFFVLLALAGSGTGVLIYLVLWILVPVEGQEEGWRPTFGESGSFEENVESNAQQVADRARVMGEDIREAVQNPHPRAGVIIGGALIILGFIYLLQNLDFAWLRWLDFDVLWPLLLVLGGVALLMRNLRGE